MMLDRLKSLPLTIGLTLLIWLYAESQVRTSPDEATTQIDNVPVWVAGPPYIINNNDVIVEPQDVMVVVAGTKQVLNELQRGQISAYLDIANEDLKASVASPEQKTLRIMTPADVKVPNPPKVKFYFREKSAPPKPGQ